MGSAATLPLTTPGPRRDARRPGVHDRRQVRGFDNDPNLVGRRELSVARGQRQHVEAWGVEGGLGVLGIDGRERDVTGTLDLAPGHVELAGGEPVVFHGPVQPRRRPEIDPLIRTGVDGRRLIRLGEPTAQQLVIVMRDPAQLTQNPCLLRLGANPPTGQLAGPPWHHDGGAAAARRALVLGRRDEQVDAAVSVAAPLAAQIELASVELRVVNGRAIAGGVVGLVRVDGE